MLISPKYAAFLCPIIARVKAGADIQNVDISAKLMVVLIKSVTTKLNTDYKETFTRVYLSRAWNLFNKIEQSSHNKHKN